MKSGRSTPSDVQVLADNLFRQQWGQLVATLTRILRDVDLAEEVVAEAFARALRVWPYRGVPDKPAAWLVAAARNRALDMLRHSARAHRKREQVSEALQQLSPPGSNPDPDLIDDQVRMLFLCCSSGLSVEASLPLTLKLVGGFSNDEIARGLLIQPATAAQRIVRTKKRLRSRFPDFELDDEQLEMRRDTVLKVVYLMFNEGYTASVGDALVRPDVCREAVRLGRLLADHPRTAAPEVDALLALMLLLSARLPARTDAAGGLVRLDDQDRSRWDSFLLREGFSRLQSASRGPRLSQYHIEAAIAAEHASAASCAATDWRTIVGLYDDLLSVTPSPLVALNRAVAVAHADGPAEALSALSDLGDSTELRNYYLLPATRGQLLLKLGRPAEAVPELERALTLPCSEPERRLLESRLAEAQGAASIQS